MKRRLRFLFCSFTHTSAKTPGLIPDRILDNRISSVVKTRVFRLRRPSLPPHQGLCRSCLLCPDSTTDSLCVGLGRSSPRRLQLVQPAAPHLLTGGTKCDGSVGLPPPASCPVQCSFEPLRSLPIYGIALPVHAYEPLRAWKPLSEG